MRLLLPFLLLFFVPLNGQRSDFNRIDFATADSIAGSHKGASLKNLPVLTHKLTASLSTEVEKFRAIYTWVSTNIENDYASYLKTSSKRKKLAKDREAFLEWNDNFTPKVFEKLVKDKKTACTGYAYLIREMASLASLNCKIINGFGRTATLHLNKNSSPNHSWNVIKLNDKWYVCDATWSAGKVFIEDDGPRFESNYFDGYFLAEPALFLKNHYPIESDFLLMTSAPTFEEFLEGPVVYKEAFEHNIVPTAPKQMFLETTRNEKIVFVLMAPFNLKGKQISMVLDNGNSSKKIVPKITRNKTQITLNHSFERTGKYDVHIKLEESLIATYVIRVKRK